MLKEIALANGIDLHIEEESPMVTEVWSECYQKYLFMSKQVSHSLTSDSDPLFYDYRK